jgi:hypothetical protein
MNAAVNFYDISRLPENVLELEGDDFYRLTKSLSGELFTEVLKLQGIDSVFLFSRTNNIFEIFQHDSATFQHLKSRIGFKLDDGTFQVKAALQIQFEYLSKLFKSKLNQQFTQSSSLSSEKINELFQKYPVLLSLLNFYENENTSNDQHEFLSLFINTITKNLSASNPSRYRYGDKLKTFAICLYILAGKTAYEFVRLNIPGALPNLTTLNTLIQNNPDKITEGKFRFNQMGKYLNSFAVQHVYCAEDCKFCINDVFWVLVLTSYTNFLQHFVCKKNYIPKQFRSEAALAR